MTGTSSRRTPGQRQQAVVTGSSSGIGLAITRGLLGEGHDVLGLSRRATRIDPVAAAEGGDTAGSYTGLDVDLRDAGALARACDELRSLEPTVVVHAAGVGEFGHLEQLSEEQIERSLRVNLLAPMRLTRAALPAMKRRGGGAVVLIGSESALRGGPQGTAYCASKFGLRGFAEALEAEAASAGIRVLQVHPGMVRTPWFDDQTFEPGPEPEHALTADDVAEVVLAGLRLPGSAVLRSVELNPLKRVVRRKERS